MIDRFNKPFERASAPGVELDKVAGLLEPAGG